MSDAKARTTGAGLLQMLQERLPEPVFAYLFSDELEAIHDELFEKHRVERVDADRIYAVELAVFAGRIRLGEFAETAWEVMSWPDERVDDARMLMADLAGKVFLPAQAHLGDVVGLLAELEADPARYGGNEIEKRVISYDQGAQEIIDHLPEMDEVMAGRARNIVLSHLRGVRVDQGTKEVLMRSAKTGGMEMSAADASSFVKAINDAMRMTTYVNQAPDEPKSEPSLPASVAAPAYSADDIRRKYAGTEEERAELARRIERFASVTNADPGATRDAFMQVLYPVDGKPADPLFVVTGLLALAQSGRLSTLLADDERYRDMVSALIVGDRQVDDPEVAEIVASMRDEPDSPEHVNAFLQLTLRGFAGYDEAQSARFGLMIINAMKRSGKKRLEGLALFDQSSGDFAWATLVPLT